MPHSLQPWKIRSSTYPLQTKWLQVRQDTCELPNGDVIDDYFVIERVDVAGIVALTPENGVVMNTQYKHGIQEFIREVPAGMIDAGETPLQAAQRELEEETGYTATEWVPLLTMVASPTGETNRYHVFLARNCVPNGKKVDFPREEIYNDVVPFNEIESRIQSGDITSMWTVVALDRARTYLEQHSLL
jgi:8-oxo-dGTP pyrophosphatase MutT (NUDIX family)